MLASPEVSILIVNYRTANELSACLKSLELQQSVSYEVIVVDNNSGGNEHLLLQSLNNECTNVIYSEENLGFGKANNLAAQHAKAELLLILNPDTLLSQANTLRRFIDAFRLMHFSLLVPVLEERSKKKNVLPRKSYPSQALCRHTDFSVLSGEYAWALGACMLMRRADYLKIGGFDHEYFMYGEDVDLCWRVRLYLGSIGLAKEITIQHIGGASEKNANSIDKWLRKRQGQYLFFKKNYHEEDVRRIVLRQRLSASLKLFKNACLNLCFGFSEYRMDEDARSTATLIASAKMAHQS